MSTGQYAGTHGNRAHGAGVATIDAGMPLDDATADQALLQGPEHRLDLIRGGGTLFTGGQFRHGLVTQGIDPLGAGLLLGDLVGGEEIRLAGGRNGLLQGNIILGRRPVPVGFARLGLHLVDHTDGGLHLLVAEHHGTQHDLLGKHPGLGFHHQHGLLGTGDHQIQVGILEGGHARVEHILTVDITHAGRTDGPLEGHAREAQGGGGPEHGGNVGIHVRIHGHDRGHHLHLVLKALGEEGTNRAVDEPAGERLLLRGAPFTLEKAAGDTAGRVGALLVVDGEREEIPAGSHFLLANRSHQHHGIRHVDHDRSRCLARDLSGFEGDGMLTVLEGLLDGCHGDSRLFPMKNLATQTQAADQILITLLVLALEVIQQLAALVDHLQQPAAGMMVLLVGGEMAHEVFDARGQQRDLDLGRARVGRITAVLFDDARLGFCVQRHTAITPEDLARRLCSW
jgi:hypothetical protein